MSKKRLISNSMMIEHRKWEYREAQSRLVSVLSYMEQDKLPPLIREALNDALAKREAWANEPLYREE